MILQKMINLLNKTDDFMTIPARPQPFKKILQQPLDISWAAFEEHVNNL